jgi:hypothetical protein
MKVHSAKVLYRAKSVAEFLTRNIAKAANEFCLKRPKIQR